MGYLGENELDKCHHCSNKKLVLGGGGGGGEGECLHGPGIKTVPPCFARFIFMRSSG